MKTIQEFKEGMTATNRNLNIIQEYNVAVLDLMDEAFNLSESIRANVEVREEVLTWFQKYTALQHEIMVRTVDNLKIALSLGQPHDVFKMATEYSGDLEMDIILSRSTELVNRAQENARDLMEHPGCFRVIELSKILTA